MRNARQIALLSVLALAGSASAGIVTATFQGVSPGVGVTFTATDIGAGGGTNAGQFNWTIGPGGNMSSRGLGNAFVAFCIELDQHVGTGGTYTYTEDNLENAAVPAGLHAPMGLATAAQLKRIYNVYHNDSSMDSAALKAAGAQVAIWNSIYDNDLDVSSGNFFLSAGDSAVIAKANSYLAAQGSANEASGLFALTSPTDQDMLVPAPALALLGLGGIAIGRRRR